MNSYAKTILVGLGIIGDEIAVSTASFILEPLGIAIPAWIPMLIALGSGMVIAKEIKKVWVEAHLVIGVSK